MTTKKITLTVPEELYKKMKALAKPINASRVFQKALVDEIKKKELFLKKMEATKDPTLLEVWNTGDFSTPSTQFELGKQMGFLYAKHQPYYKIKRFEQYADFWDNNDSNLSEEFHYELDITSILSEITQSEKLSQEQVKKAKEQENVTYLTNHFDLGFMKGIAEFLNEECGSLEIEKIVRERNKELYLAKTDDEQIKIIENYTKKLNNVAKKSK